MLGPTEFRDIVSGRRRGVTSSMLRGLLRVAEVPYSLAVRYRNRQYDAGRKPTHRVSAPVISIGNLTLGGTGKTPMVKWIARWLQANGSRAAIVSRGYGAAAGEQNDEALELAQALPNVPHIQNRDRVAGAQRAISDFAADCIVLDDGFQHRRLGRDLDIVLLDALEPFGYDHVFPRGTLREPPFGLQRAQVVCLSRADVATAQQQASIRQRVAALAPQAIWCEVAHAASSLVNAGGETQPLSALAGHRVAAFCGIGNPAGFRHTLARTACDVVSWREFPDHHPYTPAELEHVAAEAKASGAQLIVCTQKDLVKCRRDELGGLPLWAVAIEMKFLAGQEALEEQMRQLLKTSRTS
jgi:tetraacyldisaccharide 4'-kinase